MKKEIRRKDGLWLTLALAVLIALLQRNGMRPLRQAVEALPPPAATVQDSVWVHDSVRVERWQTDTVVRVRLERETIKETALPTDTGTMLNINA